MSYYDSLLAENDQAIRSALATASQLVNFTNAGNDFESTVRNFVSGCLIGNREVTSGELDTSDPKLTKQLDLVVHAALPSIFAKRAVVYSPEMILIAGEVKTTLSDQEDVLRTAERIDKFIAAADEKRRTPFVVVAGRVKHSKSWLRDLVANLSLRAPHLEPAVFCFSEDGASSTLNVTNASPLRAFADEVAVSGVIQINSDVLLPATCLYLWLNACLRGADAPTSINLESMGQFLANQTWKRPVRCLRAGLAGSEDLEIHVELGVGGGTWEPDRSPVPAVASAQRSAAAGEVLLRVDTSSAEDLTTTDDLMLISLGKWQSDPTTWDESPWGGSAQEVRSGHGFYDGMSEHELLSAARLFWRFNPRSATWDGVQYAVVAHQGITRAAIKINKMIGPLWGRHGFQGTLVTDPQLIAALVGKRVPARQNPITRLKATSGLIRADGRAA